MGKKVAELRTKVKKDLVSQLDGLKEELSQVSREQESFTRRRRQCAARGGDEHARRVRQPTRMAMRYGGGAGGSDPVCRLLAFDCRGWRPIFINC